MASINDLASLKKQVEEAKQASSKSAWALEQAVKRMKEEFGCASIEQARGKQKELEKEEAQAREEFETALAKFQNDFQERLKT